MNDVPIWRLYLLRATYLLMVVGLGLTIWPLLINPPLDLEHMRSVVRSLLGAVALLALLGIAYPLKMLPLLFFELVWKSIWLIVFGIPLWRAGALDAATRETFEATLMGLVIFPIAIPWGYAYAHYLKAPMDRWK